MILDGSEDEPKIGHVHPQQPFAANSWIGRYLDRRGKGPYVKVNAKESAQQRKIAGWKPVTLHPVTLVCVVVFTASLVAILSYLENLDGEQGGLAFVPQDQSFPALTTFGYLYLPTIISVSFSMLWAWIDLDMKRLEPFFQMAQHQGATADHSLLLQYPFDFIAWAPIKAARRRHWGVFIGGMVTVLIFWAITPLQGAVFDTRILSKSTTVSVQTLASLQNVRRSQIDESLDIGVLEEAWNIAWHNATLPSFTTRNGTFFPFQLPSLNDIGSDALITANLSFLYTTLDCNEVDVNFTSSATLRVDNGKGCVVDTDYFPNRTLLYFGYEDNARTDYSLKSFGCPEQSSSTSFLAIVSDPSTSSDVTKVPHSDTIAQFCTTMYWEQEVEASFQLPNFDINHTQPISPPIPLTLDRLNTSTFEALISNGDIGFHDPATLSNLSAAGVNSIGEWPQLYRYNFSDSYDETTTNLAGFILGTSSTRPEDYSSLLEIEKLTSALEATHQLLFAVAGSSMLLRSAATQSEPTPISATWTRTVLSVVIVQPFAFIMQSLLVTTALCALFLALYYGQRTSTLLADPDSLRHVGKLEIDVDLISLDKLVKLNSQVQFALLSNGKQNHIQARHQTALHEEPELRSTHAPPKPTRPFYLGPAVGFVFIAILMAVLATLVALRSMAESRNGLDVLWSRPITQQLLLNYLPTLLATILEPGWTLLSRMLCLLQPFEELRRLNARAEASIDSRYSSLPPQLTIVRAFKNRHLLLVATCLVAMSANLLAVSMNALFYQTETTVPVHTMFSAIKQPELSNSSFLSTALGSGPVSTSIHLQDQFYLANMNLTQNAPMPAWTAQDHYILPLSIPASPNSASVTTYDVTSLGFAFEMDCKDLGAPSTNGPFRIKRQGSSTEGSSSLGLNVTLEITNETSSVPENCTAMFTLVGDFNNSSAAVVKAFDNGNIACGQILFVIYARNIDPMSFGQQQNTSLKHSNEAVHRQGLEDKDKTTVTRDQTSQTFLACKNRLTASEYAATVSDSGMIIRSRRLDAPQLNISNYFSAEANPDALAATVNALNAAFPNMNNYLQDTILVSQIPTSQQWFPYLTSLFANSNRTLDPALAAPSAAELIPLIQGINAQLGALILASLQDILFATPDLNATQVDAVRYDSVQRVFFDDVMFPITIALLGLNILVAAIFYLRAPPKLLPEMPTTIHAQMMLFAGSSVSSAADIEAKNARYGYGRFLGLDGRLRVGIEKAAYVQTVEQS